MSITNKILEYIIIPNFKYLLYSVFPQKKKKQKQKKEQNSLHKLIILRNLYLNASLNVKDSGGFNKLKRKIYDYTHTILYSATVKTFNFN